MPGQAQEGILLSMQRAINEARGCMEEYQLERMKGYFSPEGKPLTERVGLSGGKILEVPRCSLVPQTCLAIDEVRLRYAYPAGAAEARFFREAGAAESQGKKPSPVRAFFSRLWGKLRPGKRKKQELIEVTVVFKGSGK
jgi:hypothetical protein